MRRVALAGAVLGAAFAMLPVQSANAALVVYYDFNSIGLGAVPQGTSVQNKGTLVGDGVLARGTNANNQANGVTSGIPGGAGGRALQLIPGDDTLGNIDPAYIDSGFTAGALNVTSGGSYTAMAWVNFANATGDNMIFGGNGVIANAGGGQVLHNGSRNGILHSGHWGDDLGPDQGETDSSQPGTWHHVAYTNEAGTGLQSIYFDGQLVAGPGGSNGTAGGMDNNVNLLIGTSNNGGSFNGQLDEIKIFNTLLTQGEIQAAMAVPEPGIVGLIAVGGLMLGRMSRRRRA